MALNFEFSQTGTSHFAKVIGSNESNFLVGREVGYKGNEGLTNLSAPAGLVYRAEDYKNDFKFWAYFIAPTAQAESGGSFLCLNSYDRAAFTFSFMQFAAHVPNGDFVKYFKKLLTLGNALEYFPKLRLQNNRIFYRDTNGTLTQLENDHSTQGLMDYLNPSLKDVEKQELICSARMVHWAMNDPAHRKIQVDCAIELIKENMKDYAESYNLDGYPAKICLIICDIRHQGRAASRHIINALNTGGNFNKAFDRLMQLGLPTYEGRIKTIRTEIKKLENAGLLTKNYQKSTNDFV
ncbi:MAG: hypothetical protein ABI954_05370 [Pyrinomonadaceae bacterium]